MNNEMYCTLNDCSSYESRLKLGWIVLGPLSGRQNFTSGPREWSTRVVHESGPREWSTRVVHESGPWTRSTKVVHGPGVRVLSFPITGSSFVKAFDQTENTFEGLHVPTNCFLESGLHHERYKNCFWGCAFTTAWNLPIVIFPTLKRRTENIWR
jgi:hypothetical protein